MVLERCVFVSVLVNIGYAPPLPHTHILTHRCIEGSLTVAPASVTTHMCVLLRCVVTSLNVRPSHTHTHTYTFPSTQVVILCQFLKPVDYELAFATLRNHSRSGYTLVVRCPLSLLPIPLLAVQQSHFTPTSGT